MFRRRKERTGRKAVTSGGKKKELGMLRLISADPIIVEVASNDRGERPAANGDYGGVGGRTRVLGSLHVNIDSHMPTHLVIHDTGLAPGALRQCGRVLAASRCTWVAPESGRWAEPF